MTPGDPRLVELADRMASLAADEARRLVGMCVSEMTGETAVLATIERAAQESSARIGRAVVSGVANLAGEDPPATLECGDGHRSRLVEKRPRTIQTLLGPISFERGYYHCGSCQTGFAPVDIRLGVMGTKLSPGLVRASALAGMEMPYAVSQRFIREVTGLNLASTSTINRVTVKEGNRARKAINTELSGVKSGPISQAWTSERPDKCYIVIDGTGAPMLPSETQGRMGKNAERATTREVKIGCFFTQSGFDHDNQPVIDPDSLSYSATFDPAALFAGQVKQEYYRRGFDQIRQPIILGDGAKWIWGIANERFPAATQIVDYFHTREHLTSLTGILTPLLDDPQSWGQALNEALDEGDISWIIDQVNQFKLTEQAPALIQPAATETGYFTINQHRMQYAHFKQQGYFIGSGAVESACNTLVKQRAKRAGMHWTIRGLDPVIALRTLNQSRRTSLIWNTSDSRKPVE